MQKNHGFTVIELLVVILFLGLIGALFFTQKHTIEAAHRDDQRKTAINAIYYSLEESYYKTHNYYPESLTKKTLPTMDSALLEDPDGHKIGTKESTYRYTPLDCDNDHHCKGYTVRTSLENEADFIRKSHHSN